VSDYQPTFQWHADPSWGLDDQKYFSSELQAGQLVAADIDTYFQTGWPQMWQEAAQTWGKTPEEIREAVRAYGRWLTAVADHDTAEASPERVAGTDDESSDVDGGDSDDTDGM
jgi:hypothetical protein